MGTSGAEVPGRSNVTDISRYWHGRCASHQSGCTGAELQNVMNGAITMSRAHRCAVMCAILGWLSVIPLDAAAEWFGDLYGGAAFPERTTAYFDQRYPAPATGSVSLNMGTTPTFGARVGKWIDPTPFGLAVDVSYFQRKASAGKIDIVPISALFMVRLPLYRSEEFPHGQLQPYVGIGPSFFVANGSIASSGPGIDPVNRSRTDFGFDVRAGVAWQLKKHLALFSEYRFSDVNLRFLDRRCRAESCAPLQTDVVSETKVSLGTHHILVGVRF